jgi:hypothetical protein
MDATHVNRSSIFTDPKKFRIVLWLIASTPLYLAVLAYGMRVWVFGGGFHDGVISTLSVIFAMISLIMVWTSFYNASGKLDPKTGSSFSPTRAGISHSTFRRIDAVALAIVPAILGLVLHVLFGDRLALLLFNGTALVIAVRHVLVFTKADMKS